MRETDHQQSGLFSHMLATREKEGIYDAVPALELRVCTRLCRCDCGIRNENGIRSDKKPCSQDTA
jgi:hypothetical protein